MEFLILKLLEKMRLKARSLFKSLLIKKIFSIKL